jgi:hypothetical protein
MSLIEHSEYICDDGCGRVDVRGAVEGPWPLCLNCGARVTEYVPADAYRGAVEALRELIEDAERAYNTGDVQEIDLGTATAALARYGGQ